MNRQQAMHRITELEGRAERAEAKASKMNMFMFGSGILGVLLVISIGTSVWGINAASDMERQNLMMRYEIAQSRCPSILEGIGLSMDGAIGEAADRATDKLLERLEN